MIDDTLDADAPRQLERCVVAGCKRMAAGLYCKWHQRRLATLDEGDDEPEPPRGA